MMAEQNQNQNSNQEVTGESQFPGLYVFSCYRHAGSRIGEYTPFANKLVAVPTDETYDARKPQLMRTNEVGKLYSLTAELGNRQLMHHLAKGKSLVVPPAELVSFAAAADGKNWRKNITDALSLLRNSEALQPLKLEKIKVEHLRKVNRGQP